jgi:ribonuclease HII
MLYYEKKLKGLGYDLIIGVDEAGRGPLAGPVVAAAVLLKTYRFKNRIDDSKKLTSLERARAAQEIAKKSSFGIGIISEKIIDRVNILEATRLAMSQALDLLVKQLRDIPQDKVHIIVDGNTGFASSFAMTSIIKGDAKSKSIACASILAKVRRDRIMQKLDKKFPRYGFIHHKGYPTKEHRQALARFGPSPVHRMSFCLD